MSGEAVKRRDQAASLITKLLGKARRQSNEATDRELNSYVDQLEDGFQEYLASQEKVLEYTGSAALSFEEHHSVAVTAAYKQARELFFAAIELHRSQDTDTTQQFSGPNIFKAPSESSTSSTMEEQVKKLNEQVMQLQQMLIANQAHQIDQAAAHRPLVPRITLPKFSGNISEWTQFHDLFMSLIGNNTRLSGSEKMHHLKSALSGEAELLLRPFAISDLNYPEAWQMLSSRYDNQRLIIGKHLDNLLDIAKITKQEFRQLRKLIDTANESVRSLRVLKQPVDKWDTILVHILAKKLDSDSRRQWELQLEREGGQPAFTEFITFLDRLCRAFEASTTSVSSSVSSRPSYSSTRRQPATQSHHVSTSAYACVKCQGPHSIRTCSKFKEMPVSTRRSFVAEKDLCFNCMSANHIVRNCKSEESCKKCKQKHHTLLHLYQNTEEFSTSSATNSNNSNIATRSADIAPTTTTALFSNATQHNRQIMLATALVTVHTPWGDQPIRLLIDSGSESSFVTDKTVQRLRLRKTKANVNVTGIGGSSSGMISGLTEFTIKSTHSTYTLQMEALVLPKITLDLPRKSITIGDWPHITGLSLADPNFDKTGPIDVLLGADYVHEIIDGGIRRGEPGTPIAQETKFGWILSGSVEATNHQKSSVSLHGTTSIEETLRKFWEIEEVEVRRQHTKEETECEQHFSDTHTRLTSGRYVVQLPFRKATGALGNSRNAAATRLSQMERRFKTNAKLHESYSAFMNEYENLGHMREVEPGVSPEESYFLPHHAVFKADSSTTKLRVVFDASRPSTSGLSLNDKLMVGPRLQDDLYIILLRFRRNRIAITADITKMYRQIEIAPVHRNFQRILWRNSTDEPVKEFQLSTVTYGTSAAPHLAVRALQQLAFDEQQDFPAAAATVLNDFYVDDLITGCDSDQVGIEIQRSITSLLQRGGFEIRKWTSNSKSVLSEVPVDHQEIKPDKEFSRNSVKTLGLHWKPAIDVIFFKPSLTRNSSIATKRTLLSDIAKLFDPIGLLAPVVITGKIMLQQLWLRELGWDDPLPNDIRQLWESYRNNLLNIENITINRWLFTTSTCKTQLHGFADASERAYAAVIYVRTIEINGIIKTSLITAKTKVAPTKQLSVPRLELCAALLLADLLTTVKRALDLNNVQTFAWSDSTITLAWINGQPTTWKTFVANRVAKIQHQIDTQSWKHITSAENPADCASRGLPPSELENFPLWWHGPTWLSKPEAEWPMSYVDTQTTLEAKPILTCYVTTQVEDDMLIKYSSWAKLLRITALCLRFKTNSDGTRNKGWLNTSELDLAAKIWIRRAQSDHFARELSSFATNQSISTKSSIASLLPFIDENRLLRVGGRIHRSPAPYQQRHQLILPPKHPVTQLILQQLHSTNLHAGIQLMLVQLRQQYWIPGARSIIRQLIHRCVTCFRFRAGPHNQLMGTLPSVRVTPGNAFSKTGVDYAGPIMLRLAYVRGPPKTYKAYVAVFVCMVTRAIHLEAVSDMTSEAFIKAFTRFTARRGHCTDLYSDNGTTFKGADHELQLMLKQLSAQQHNSRIAHSLISRGTNWHFIPPAAPHFGGLWEAGVKSMKQHLRRVMGSSMLTFDDLQTLLCQIEGCLNSRPLCPVSDDPNDFTYLTPSMLVSGINTQSVPEPDLTNLPLNRLSRYQQIIKQKQDFWKIWKNEYLVRLQQRTKWQSPKANVIPNQLVLIIDDNISPTHWKMGRVISIHPGIDGLVRVVTIGLGPNITPRKLPITKICVLPLANQSD